MRHFICTFLVKNHLINDDVVRINIKFCKFLYQSFCFIKREKLWYAHTDKCRHILSSKRRNSTNKNREYNLNLPLKLVHVILNYTLKM